MLDLWNPWEIYDRLIDQIDPTVQVTASGRFGKWAFIENSEAGAGMAFHIPVESIARRLPADPSGMSLREVAAYAKSWNFAEAALGMAAVNSWYALPSRAEAAGFVPCQVNNWQNLFDPWSRLLGISPLLPRPSLPHLSSLSSSATCWTEIYQIRPQSMFFPPATTSLLRALPL